MVTPQTVLVLEDDGPVRRFITDMLTCAGYRVLSAADANEAVQQAEERIDLLLSDVVLPNVSGPVCARRLAERFPGLRVLYMSGYLDPDVLRRLGLEDDMPFLQKPFTGSVLRKVIAGVLSCGMPLTNCEVAAD